MARTIKRFAMIEAIRGLAALLVVWSHTMPKDNPFYYHFFDPGKIGVVVFFFISGYLVIPSAARDASPKSFLIKRVSRLYPLYWLSIAAAFLLYGNTLSDLTWIANATMAQQLLGFKNAISVYWTLTIEFCLYVILTAALIKKQSILKGDLAKFVLGLAILCLTLGLARLALQTKVPTAIPLGLFCMFIGAWSRALENEGKSLNQIVALYIATVVPTCILAYSFGVSHNETWTRYVVTYISGGAIFYLLLKKPNVNLGYIPRALGDYSYGIYLFHALLIFIFETYFGMEKSMSLFLLTITTSCVVSIPLYHLVEKPAAALGREIAQRTLRREAV